MKDLGGSIGEMYAVVARMPNARATGVPGLDRLLSQSALLAADGTSYLLVLAGMALAGAGSDALLLKLFGLAAIGTMAAYAGFALYPGYRLHPQELLRRRAVGAVAVACVAALSVLAILGDWRLAGVLVLCLAVALVVQLPLRALVCRMLRRGGLWGEDVVVIGGQGIDDYFVKNWQYGIRPRRSHGGAAFPERLGGDVGAPRGRVRAKTAILATGSVPSRDHIAAISRLYDEVILLADLPDRKVSGVQPAHLNGAIGLTLKKAGPGPVAGGLRRAMDLAFAVPAAAIAAPLVGMAAIAIRIVDPGPVFFRHEREGLSGRPIRLLKLRTMYQDAEARLALLLETEPKAKAEWETHFKLANDPRILPGVGAFLRASSCDELPQLYHVFTGELSVVGPRPFPDYHLAAMDDAFRRKRASITPGITGLWQVSERSDADVALQTQLDDFYIDNRSVWLDATILVRTAFAVVNGRGAR